MNPYITRRLVSTRFRFTCTICSYRSYTISSRVLLWIDSIYFFAISSLNFYPYFTLADIYSISRKSAEFSPSSSSWMVSS